MVNYMYETQLQRTSRFIKFIKKLVCHLFFQYLAALIKEKQQTLTYWKLEPREHCHICLQNK